MANRVRESSSPGRDALALDDVADNSIVRMPIVQSTRLMKSAKLSERMTPMLWASLFQSADRCDGCTGQADEAEPGNRHAFAWLPEGLGEHGGNRREGDDDEAESVRRIKSLLATRAFAAGGSRGG